MVDFLKLADRSWPVLGRVMQAHAAIYRVTNGRIGRRLPGLPPMLLLDHVGARSGKVRTAPLVYMPDGDSFVVVAAKGGHPRHPSWVHNLRARPDTEVQIGSTRIPVHAREANAQERGHLWPTAVAYNPVWGDYQRRTRRTVPLVILEPREP
jgi:deazaflavin-dependent oxidoreductase (nitroreductase family)